MAFRTRRDNPSDQSTLTDSLVAVGIDPCIQKRIHERIHQDLPAFEQQVASSKSVQERLHSLTSNVDCLNNRLSNSEVRTPPNGTKMGQQFWYSKQSGLIPSLLKALTAHAALAQRTQDTATIHSALAYIHRCKSEFEGLTSLIQAGKLPEAVTTCEGLNTLLSEAPLALSQANIMNDMKVSSCLARQESRIYPHTFVV